MKKTILTIVFLFGSLLVSTASAISTLPIVMILSRHKHPFDAFIFGGLGGLFLMFIMSIFNGNSKKKYFKKILKDPDAFKKQLLEEYEKELVKSDLAEEDQISVEDFRKMLDSYIVYIQNEKKEMLDTYMNRYFQNLFAKK
ncbi:MAG: hypothetical protein LBJ63_00750 [Prevotellaceae bacterium]|jgi:hypothetical protein|nr:hypothetical protein [Prevotellaceae bacterium]